MAARYQFLDDKGGFLHREKVVVTLLGPGAVPLVDIEGEVNGWYDPPYAGDSGDPSPWLELVTDAGAALRISWHAIAYVSSMESV